MQDYTPNSHRFKAEQKELSEKKVEKVISGKVKTKQNNTRKLTNIFISEDASNVKSYILMDVLVPAIKKAVSDIVRDGIDMLLYGEPHGRKSGSSAPYVSYRNYSDKRGGERTRTRTRSSYDFDDIILETRGEAEEVLDQMDELIETYGIVTVADLYDLVGMNHNFTDNKYGWSNLRNAQPVRDRDGYVLKLPRAVPID